MRLALGSLVASLAADEWVSEHGGKCASPASSLGGRRQQHAAHTEHEKPARGGAVGGGNLAERERHRWRREGAGGLRVCELRDKRLQEGPEKFGEASEKVRREGVCKLRDERLRPRLRGKLGDVLVRVRVQHLIS